MKSYGKFVNLDNARHRDQRSIMKRSQNEDFCPFCPDHIDQVETKEIIKQGTFWQVRENRWPYHGTKIHLLVIHNSHVDKITDITKESWEELREIVKWAEAEYDILGGALGIRFGDPELNGGTITHLHAHIIAADPAATGCQRVRFAMGPKIRKTNKKITP